MEYILTIEVFDFLKRKKKILDINVLSGELYNIISNYIYSKYKSYAFVTKDNVDTNIISKFNSVRYNIKINKVENNLIYLFINNLEFKINYKNLKPFIEENIKEILPTLK